MSSRTDNFSNLSDFLNHFHNKYNKSGDTNVFSKKATLWKSILEPRKSLKKINESTLQSFLDPSTHLSSGTSDWKREIDNNLISYFIEKIPHSYLNNSLKVPTTGNPIMFPVLDSLELCTPYAWNLMTFSCFMNMYKPLHKGNKIDVVEIGAGYGCAALMWINSGLVNSYTIVDLEENLINSAFYLGDNTGWDNINLIEKPFENLKENSVNLLTPGNINNLKGHLFDLAINSDSLGEMPLDTCQAYVNWVLINIKENGYFLTKNGHRRCKDGIQRLDEYGYEAFHLADITPPLYSSSGFDDFSHNLLLQKSSETIDSKKLSYLDILSNLYALGLGKDLVSISDKLKNNLLSDDDIHFLEVSNLIMRDEYIEDKVHSNEIEYSFMIDYLLAYKACIDSKKIEKDLFMNYLDNGTSDIARFYSYLFMSYHRIIQIDDDLLNNESSAGVRFFMSELISFEKSNFFVKKIKYLIRLDNLRKKIYPYKSYKPSLLVRLKNIYKNFSEFRKLSFYR